jgi:hypothetical protein
VYGNKKDSDGKILNAKGVKREFEISISQGLIPIPIAPTGYAAKEIFDEVTNPKNNYYAGNEWIITHLKSIEGDLLKDEGIITKIINIIQTINK